jgi:hypothetical protein
MAIACTTTTPMPSDDLSISFHHEKEDGSQAWNFRFFGVWRRKETKKVIVQGTAAGESWHLQLLGLFTFLSLMKRKKMIFRLR